MVGGIVVWAKKVAVRAKGEDGENLNFADKTLGAACRL
jgi:hypothetical protein